MSPNGREVEHSRPFPGCGPVWLGRPPRTREIAGSNPATQTNTVWGRAGNIQVMKVILIQGSFPKIEANAVGVQIDDSGDRVAPLNGEAESFPLFFEALIREGRKDLKPKAFSILEGRMRTGLQDRCAVLDEIVRELTGKPAVICIYAHTPLQVFPARDENDPTLVGWQARIELSMFGLDKPPSAETENVRIPPEDEEVDFSLTRDMNDLDTIQLARALILHWLPLRGKAKA